tara:strand:- start:946 stop:1353 length:408 start_codon:yes stop_codon:yes gene_type:complete
MKGNKLIAEFMGYKVIDKPKVVNGENFFEYIDENGKYTYCNSLLRYNDQWNWLMPVAKKCINPEDNTEGWDNLAVALTTCNIDEVYQAVVEFIKEHNEINRLVGLSKYTCDSCGDRVDTVAFNEDKDINECMDCM